MKTILLHTPCADNSGHRRDAGETLVVGEEADAIAAPRAAALVEAGSAIDTSPADKASAKKAD